MTQPQTAKQVVSSDTGWRVFARVLTESAPRGYANANSARKAIRRLVQAGR